MPDRSVKKEIIFIISADQADKVKKWQDKHPCRMRGKYKGAIGGGLTFSFTSTGIGQVQKVSCECGKEFDFTDYDSW